MDTSTSTTWTCGQCGRRVPSRIDACRCGATRDAAVSSAPAPPSVPAHPARRGLSAFGFALRIVLGMAVFGGLGAGWYVWTKGAADEQKASMARTAAAVARRVNREPTIEVRDANAPAPATVTPPVAPLQAGTVLLAPPPADAAATAPIPLEDLVARVGPAVVSIQTSAGRGTGFFVAPDTIITNAHVAGSDVTVRIHRTTGDTMDARVERVAADLDLAVLKLPQPLANQTVVPLGTAARVRSGEDVVAIGSALGVLQNSVTRGIVSAVRRADSVTLIQTDAAINPGNSGGPLLDRSGTVIGINTMTARSAQGISFAVAVDHARELMSGQHVATTSRTPLSTMNEAMSGKSEKPDTEASRADAERQYDQALVRVARRADELDDYWRRFRQQCYEGRIAGNFDREWFSIFEPKAMQGAVSPGCGQSFNEARTEAYAIRNTVEQLEEAARKADIYPGVRRDLRHKYHLDYAGWDR